MSLRRFRKPGKSVGLGCPERGLETLSPVRRQASGSPLPGSPAGVRAGVFAVIKALVQIYWRRSLNGNTVECGLFCVQELHLSQK